MPYASKHGTWILSASAPQLCCSAVLSEPATVTVVTSDFLLHSKTPWPCTTQSQLLPISALITLHSILDVTFPTTSWHLPSTFLVPKNALPSVVQDDTFDTNDTKLHSSAFVTTRQNVTIDPTWKKYQFRSQGIGQPCPRDCHWNAFVVAGPGNDTEHWTKPCPWAVGSSSSRGWTESPRVVKVQG